MPDHSMLDKENPRIKKDAPESEIAPENTTFEGKMLGLQTTLGNQGVQRMLSGDKASRPPLFIQTKLTVGAADDAYEQEADRVAHEVVHNTNTNDTAQRQGPDEEELQMKRIQRESEGGETEEEELQMKRIQRESEGGETEEEELQMKRIQRESEGPELEEEDMQAKRIQREVAPEEEELQMKRIQRESEGPELEEEDMQAKRIQRAAQDMSGSFDVGEDVESAIQAKKGGGSPLPDNTRAKMESGFGQDFSNVKVHNDNESDNLNQSVQARAFTTGSDIFFRKGEYNPDSSAGQELLAHELTHVVQQGGSIAKKGQEES